MRKLGFFGTNNESFEALELQLRRHKSRVVKRAVKRRHSVYGVPHI